MSRKIPQLSASDLERFWAKVDKSGACWEWTAAKITNGYGSFGISGGVYLAHRVSYFITYGVDPGELCCCHQCDNPSCVRPDHLWLGTDADNVEDREWKGRGGGSLIQGEQNVLAKLTEADVVDIRESDEFNQVLASQYGVSPSLVSKIKCGKSWAHVGGKLDLPQSPRGERHGHSKLTEQDVREIRASNEKQYVLAQQYDVTRSLISQIKRNKIWSHIA